MGGIVNFFRDGHTGADNVFGMRGRRTAGLFAAAVLLAGCAADPPDSHAPSETASGPQPNPPSSIGEASEEEVGTDWKAGPTAQVPEESELSDQQRTEMLRLTATHPHTEDSCEAAELTGQLRYTDAATGSRYGVVLLRNDGEAPCTLQGHPGLGAPGRTRTPIPHPSRAVRGDPSRTV